MNTGEMIENIDYVDAGAMPMCRRSGLSSLAGCRAQLAGTGVI